MRTTKFIIARLVAASVAVILLCAFAGAQQVTRLVVIKVDGLPNYFVDDVVKRRDPKTGKSMLPWIDEIFYRNGTRVPNFYSRGMSLSGPAWSMLDTGQHLQIKGNDDFDRYTLKSYDYLNLVPFYYGYTFGKVVDSTGVQVLDTVGVPLLSDAFSLDSKYTSQQLYQRGWNWGVFGGAFMNMIPRDRSDIIDEWTLGFETTLMTVRQNERDIVEKLGQFPQYDYFDYFNMAFDHVSHHNNDEQSRVNALKDIDQSIGNIWVAIQRTPRASETALVLVSDHGFNSDPRVYSQGFNLVKLLASQAGGGHHVVTKRFLQMQYSFKSLNPFAGLVRTSSAESYYLKGQADKYPTAVLDFDGNERASIHLRNSDLNTLHILLLELKKKDLAASLRTAAASTVISVIERHRLDWQRTASEMTDELDALERWVKATKKTLADLPTTESKTVTKEQVLASRRVREQIDNAEKDIPDYRRYVASLTKLLSAKRDDLVARKFDIEDLIAPNAMGDENSVGELQNYVVGLSPSGLHVASDGRLDLERSFVHINYLNLLLAQRVRNNVQAGVSNRPIDFIAMRVPLTSIEDSLSPELMPDDDPILLYAGDDAEVLVLTRKDANGEETYRYLPISDLKQDTDGHVTFTTQQIRPGLPLHYFEDAELNVAGDRTAWLNAWHTEIEWLRAVHRCTYSNGIISLNEQMDDHPMPDSGAIGDAALIERFHKRQRRITDADLLIEASNHWNFDVRGFNPGGNHGSFFRVSTNATFMIAGGDATRIPRGLAVDEPYDSLSFAPTLLRLMGKIDPQNRPNADLAAKGYSQFPGRVVTETMSR